MIKWNVFSIIKETTEKNLFIAIIKFHQMENIINCSVKTKITLEQLNFLLNQKIL